MHQTGCLKKNLSLFNHKVFPSSILSFMMILNTNAVYNNTGVLKKGRLNSKNQLHKTKLNFLDGIKKVMPS